MTDIVEWYEGLCGAASDVIKRHLKENERLREELNEYKLKLRAAYEREAGWIENISNCKNENERLKKSLSEIVLWEEE